ncbi:MAG TPA: hypothetical protein PLA79_14180, partial [Bacteroidales bacterium]|nr:hypothetical protein [Bacteroidales bacterium]
MKIFNRIRIYLIGLLIVFIVILFGHFITTTYAFERGFNRSAFKESRGVVFEDFNNDFTSTNDWIFGRGLEGRVYR